MTQNTGFASLDLPNYNKLYNNYDYHYREEGPPLSLHPFDAAPLDSLNHDPLDTMMTPNQPATTSAGRRRSSVSTLWASIKGNRDAQGRNSLSRITTTATTSSAAPAPAAKTQYDHLARRKSSPGRLFTPASQPKTSTDKLGRRRSSVYMPRGHNEHKGYGKKTDNNHVSIVRMH